MTLHRVAYWVVVGLLALAAVSCERELLPDEAGTEADSTTVVIVITGPRWGE